MGKWINLDKIDLALFRKSEGYTPEGHFTNIQYHRDSQFIFPTKYIPPLNWNIMDNMSVIKFFNGHREFHLPEKVMWVNKYSFIPGPGEIRPTHNIWRYDLFPRQPMSTPAVFQGDFADFHRHYKGADYVDPLKQVVLKAVNPKYGYQEYRKQRDLIKKGFPTPNVYHYETYFSPIMMGFVNIINQPHHVLQRQCRWAYDFVNQLEQNEKNFVEFENETRRFRLLLQSLEEHDEFVKTHKQARKNLARYMEDFEDIRAVTDDGNRSLKGYFTMDYWSGLTSFERILFDLLGGRKLETYSRFISLLDQPPVFNGPEVAKAVVEIITRLWDLGVTHNDLKGEHVVYENNLDTWGMIDWGELTPGTPGKDLALFLKDSTDFIHHRILFNRRFLKRTFKDKYGEDFTKQSRNYRRVKANFDRVSREITHNEPLFWRYFLKKMAEKAGKDVLLDAIEIGLSRNLKFNWEFVREAARESRS